MHSKWAQYAQTLNALVCLKIKFAHFENMQIRKSMILETLDTMETSWTLQTLDTTLTLNTLHTLNTPATVNDIH